MFRRTSRKRTLKKWPEISSSWFKPKLLVAFTNFYMIFDCVIKTTFQMIFFHAVFKWLSDNCKNSQVICKLMYKQLIRLDEVLVNLNAWCTLCRKFFNEMLKVNFQALKSWGWTFGLEPCTDSIVDYCSVEKGKGKRLKAFQPQSRNCLQKCQSQFQ